jgi:DNA-binding NarL/FixJ family response regulator
MPPNRITVVTVDDHPLLREGIASVLRTLPDVELIGEAANGREALALVLERCPDITLMDIQMPVMNGIEALVAIREARPAAKVIMLSTYSGDVQAMRAIKAGAASYLLKSMIHKELGAAIRKVHAGQSYIPLEIATALAEHVGMGQLSEREITVLKLAAVGNTNKRIGAQLGLSEDTVKGHMKNVIAKLQAQDRTHAVTIAVRRGIIELP